MEIKNFILTLTQLAILRLFALQIKRLVRHPVTSLQTQTQSFSFSSTSATSALIHGWRQETGSSVELGDKSIGSRIP